MITYQLTDEDIVSGNRLWWRYRVKPYAFIGALLLLWFGLCVFSGLTGRETLVVAIVINFFTSLEDMRAESGRVLWQISYGSLNLAGSNRVAKDKIRRPILSLVGCQDRAVPVGVARAMAHWYGPKLQHREYADHAHWMLGEVGWEQRVNEVNAWLADQAFP